MEEQKNNPVSDLELMQKLSRFVRRTRMSGHGPEPVGRGNFPGLGPKGPEGPAHMSHPGEAFFNPQGREQRGMPPFGLQGMDRPPMPPCGPQGMNHPQMSACGPQGMDRPPMPACGPQGMDRPPVPPCGPEGMRRPPLPRENMLVLIGENPDGIRQKALAEKLGINQSSTSELVNKLESGGYLARKVDPEDRRATLLFLTELGQARAAEVKAEQEVSLGSMFSRLTQDEKQTLSALLDKLLGDGSEE